MRKKLLVRFGTVGSIIDMLRYDQAFPATEDDARKISKAQMGGGERTKLDHVVKLIATGHDAPSTLRWQSFACDVLAVGADVDKKYDALVHKYGSENPLLTISAARRLYREAASMTVKELYANGRKYGHAWLTGIPKPKLVQLFRRAMEDFLIKNGATL